MPICPKCKEESSELLAPCPSDHESYCIEEEEYYAHKSDIFLGRKIAGRYIVQSVLGRGSMARVYEAHQGKVDRTVALKIFRPETILGRRRGTDTTDDEREQAEQQFVREAKVLGRFSHPNCVTVYDFGAEDGGSFLYIAMEFVAGSALRTAIRRGLKLEAITEIGRQLLGALREAHSLGIVHRDLKPENIILSYRTLRDEHVVKVLDFGIAKLLADTDHGGQGQLFGTPAYMSPEQCRGEEDSVGPPADIYAFGCIFYEMLCGHLPFPADNPHEMVRAHQEVPIPDLDVRPGLDVPEPLKEVTRRCLQKEPDERYQTGAEALTALEEAIARSDVPFSTGLDMFSSPREGHGEAAKQRDVVVPENRVSGIELDPLGNGGGGDREASPASDADGPEEPTEQLPTLSSESTPDDPEEPTEQLPTLSSESTPDEHAAPPEQLSSSSSDEDSDTHTEPTERLSIPSPEDVLDSSSDESGTDPVRETPTMDGAISATRETIQLDGAESAKETIAREDLSRTSEASTLTSVFENMEPRTLAAVATVFVVGVAVVLLFYFIAISIQS